METNRELLFTAPSEPEDLLDLKRVLVGRRVVKAEKVEDMPDPTGYWHSTGALIHLDDGTVLEVPPRDGGCGCSAGCYWVEELDSADGAVIMDVKSVEDPPSEDEDGEGYKLFIYAEGVGERQLLAMGGDDGNGYYGTGYSIYIRKPEA